MVHNRLAPDEPLKPSLAQYVLATNWVPYLWQWTWAMSAVAWAAYALRPTIAAFSNVWFLLFGVLTIVLAFAAGWFASIIPTWLLFGPILHDRGLANGGPFGPGDWVQVIAGKHRGRVVQVYSEWQNNTVRVDLGDSEKQRYADIFSAYELFRQSDDSQSTKHAAADDGE
jgi:hypothetical protein